MPRRRLPLMAVAISLPAIPAAARGGVVAFTDKDEWIAAVGPFKTIDFTGFPHGTPITEQYSKLGVHFTSSVNFVLCCDDSTFPNDGAGLDGNDQIVLVFDTLQAWIAVDFPGAVQVELSRNDEVIYTSRFFGGRPGSFVGLVSSELLDRAVLRDFDQNVVVDDLHFGPFSCLGEVDGDGRVGSADLAELLKAWGSDPAGPPDFDGNGDVGITDLLMLLANWGLCPSLPDCNHNDVFDLIDINVGTSQDCNVNAVPDECDIAEGTSPDRNGNQVPDECERARNDTCENATRISDGPTPFLTFGATTDGPLAVCGAGSFEFVNDIWFLYTASCTGIATFSLCKDAEFDTVLALYSGGACPPPLNPLACSDNAPGCGETSELSRPVIDGFPYLVRVGGTQGGGFGFLTVSCEPGP